MGLQANERRLASGLRGAALIGDSTGSGKGRMAAAYIVENYLRGRKFVVYLSATADLSADLARDMFDCCSSNIRE